MTKDNEAVSNMATEINTASGSGLNAVLARHTYYEARLRTLRRETDDAVESQLKLDLREDDILEEIPMEEASTRGSSSRYYAKHLRPAEYKRLYSRHTQGSGRHTVSYFNASKMKPALDPEDDWEQRISAPSRMDDDASLGDAIDATEQEDCLAPLEEDMFSSELASPKERKSPRKSFSIGPKLLSSTEWRSRFDEASKQRFERRAAKAKAEVSDPIDLLQSVPFVRACTELNADIDPLSPMVSDLGSLATTFERAITDFVKEDPRAKVLKAANVEPKQAAGSEAIAPKPPTEDRPAKSSNLHSHKFKRDMP
jgi:hypothetical protein